MPTRWILLAFIGLGCASSKPSSSERELREQTTRLTEERSACQARLDELAAHTRNLEAQLAEQRKVSLTMSHSMLNKAEAVALLKLQLLAFQRAVSETAGLPLAEDLAAMEPSLKAQIARIQNMRQNLPPRPFDSFDEEEERMLIEARERVLGR